MESNYERRLRETRARTYKQNQEDYRQRLLDNKPVGVVERVLLEQMRSELLADESDSCAGSRLDNGPSDSDR